MEGTADALKRAAEKLGFDVKNCCTHDKALEEFQTVHQDLIIIDSRSKALDFDTLCRFVTNNFIVLSLAGPNIHNMRRHLNTAESIDP